MRTKSPELESKRREEILDACEKLYQTKCFKDIMIKDISLETSLSRPSVYNYYETKEEIFLGLLGREVGFWIEALNGLEFSNENSRENSAEMIAQTLSERKLMLKILATNIYEIEENSRTERLMEYKEIYRSASIAFRDMLKRIVPDMTDRKAFSVEAAFFPFLNGVYAYCFPTEKQKAAMDGIGLEYTTPSIYRSVKNCLVQML